MKNFRWLHVCIVSVGIILVLISLFTGIPSAIAQVHSNTLTSNDTQIHPDSIPWYQAAVPINKKNTQSSCLSRVSSMYCYSPQQIRQAYNIQPLLNAGITGKGQTIVIIDPFQDPNIRTELSIFDQMFGLSDPVLNIFSPFGLTPFMPTNPQQRIAASEISLDVEWAHAIAPAATIDLVLSPTTAYNDIYRTTKFAVDMNLGSIITQSFGGSETCLPTSFVTEEHALFIEAQAKGISALAATGDTGTFVPVCSGENQKTLIALGPGVDYPASDPLVTSVSGTRLLASLNGSYISETTWNDTNAPSGRGATGGGFSEIFPRPSYQNGIARIGTTRGLPDVAFDADPRTGVAVVTIIAGIPLLVPFGGTSVGVPQWGAVIALANQRVGKNLGFLNNTLYTIGKGSGYANAFHDVVTGNNITRVKIGALTLTIPGYSAGPGWDPTTGFGTPKATQLIKQITTLTDSKTPACTSTVAKSCPSSAQRMMYMLSAHHSQGHSPQRIRHPHAINTHGKRYRKRHKAHHISNHHQCHCTHNSYHYNNRGPWHRHRLTHHHQA